MRSLFYFVFFLFFSSQALGQGMPLDSLSTRITSDLHNSALAGQLRTLIPNYEHQRVWGYSAGDFTNDSLPDLALSLYDLSPGGAKNQVHVYLFANTGQSLVDRFDKVVSYVESPIEVGLSTDGSVVTLIQKRGDQQWSQQGYSIEAGDVVLVDRFETEQESVGSAGSSSSRSRAIGHDLYRNYESLRTRESYFTGGPAAPNATQATSSQGAPSPKARPQAGEDAMFTNQYFTLPAYQRLRDVYPGYGRVLTDTSSAFVISGETFRKGGSDLSIGNAQSAYDDQNLYLSFSVVDDYVVGGSPTLSNNDRVSLWFDTKYTGDRLNRDRRILTKQGGFPTFRDAIDSLVTNITFGLPAQPGSVSQITYSSVLPLSSLQQEGLRNVRGHMSFDTLNGVVNGYTLKLKIPFAFLGFELNPAKLYEKPPTLATSGSPATETGGAMSNPSLSDQSLSDQSEAATLGFTSIVYDVDDPSHPMEVTEEATSTYKEGNPATFGTLILEPSSLYYGEVHATYLKQVHEALVAAGF